MRGLPRSAPVSLGRVATEARRISGVKRHRDQCGPRQDEPNATRCLLLRQGGCLMLRQEGCLLPRQDGCLLLRQMFALEARQMSNVATGRCPALVLYICLLSAADSCPGSAADICLVLTTHIRPLNRRCPYYFNRSHYSCGPPAGSRPFF